MEFPGGRVPYTTRLRFVAGCPRAPGRRRRPQLNGPPHPATLRLAARRRAPLLARPLALLPPAPRHPLLPHPRPRGPAPARRRRPARPRRALRRRPLRGRGRRWRWRTVGTRVREISIIIKHSLGLTLPRSKHTGPKYVQGLQAFAAAAPAAAAVPPPAQKNPLVAQKRDVAKPGSPALFKTCGSGSGASQRRCETARFFSTTLQKMR